MPQLPIGLELLKRIALGLGAAVLLIAYAWIASVALQPNSSFDRSVVADAAVKRDGGIEPWSDSGLGSVDGFPIMGARARAIASDVAAFAAPLGGFDRPLELIVDVDDPLRWAISAERVEIGARLIAAEGQFAKALLKAWTLQNAGAAIVASAARAEIVSDAMLAMMNGGFRLEDPRTRAIATYSAAAAAPSWLSQIQSLGRACETGWAPLEVASLCRENRAERLAWADEASELGTRALIGGMVWRAYERLSPFERLEFARSWGRWLRDPMGRRAGAAPTTLVAWREWLAQEFEFVLPPSVYPGARALENLALLEREAQLRSGDALALDFAARLEKPVARELASSPAWKAVVRAPAAATPTPSRGAGWIGVRLEAEGARLYPGEVRIGTADARALLVGDLIWESCAAPTIGEVVASAQSKRILFTQNCGEAEIDYRSYLRFGGEAFARANPTAPFLQMRRSSLEYLLAKGLKRSGDSVLSLVDQNEGVLARALLPRQEAWLRRERAFRVAGALADVVLYRPASAGR